MGRKSSAAAAGDEEEAVPENLRCGRTDGRQWRCRRRVMDNLKLCEIHYLQGRHRQFKEKVPESLKLQRKKRNSSHSPPPASVNNVEIRARKTFNLANKKRKLSDGSDALVTRKIKKKKKKQRNKNKNKKHGVGDGGDMQLELIRMVLKREVEKRKNKKRKKGEEEEEDDDDDEETEDELQCSRGVELRRELANGVMAISPASKKHDHSDNVGSRCDVKVGASDSKAITVTPRYFRSKNVDRVPVGKLQVVPYGQDLKKGKGKKKRCHWCQRSDSCNLIKCSNCQKEFFCVDCIKERYFDTQNEVKKACPVCRGTCTCKDCLASPHKDSESKECLTGEGRVDGILHFHYLICMLLPVLKQIIEDQYTQLETEAKVKGKNISDIHIKQVEFGCNEQNYCNLCKTPILDLHRSCPSCSYSLCLSCCRELSQGRTPGEINSSKFKLPGKMKACNTDECQTLDEKAISSGNLTSDSILPDQTNCNGIDSVSCPPTEFGGCGNSHLDLRCVFPSSWIKEMEEKAEEIVCSYEFPETSDKSSTCSMCSDADRKTKRYRQLQEAAVREDSNDNCLFHPTVLDISGGNNFEHFQKHWGKGHPIVVQDVLQNTSNLSWDPLVMFCTYLDRSITRYESNKDLLESCLDWCEVEINIRQHFTGSLKRRPQKNTWHEMLKLKGWLSSQLFKEHFPAHFSEVIDSLPVQEYMNPTSGLLNLAANLPHGSTKHDIGPYVYISYGCADREADSVTKLCYDSYDVVNIMAHTTDVPLTTEQLTKIRRQLKKHKALCQKESSKIATEHLLEQKVKGMSTQHAEDTEQKGSLLQDTEQKGSQSMINGEMDFYRRVNRTSYISTETDKAASHGTDNVISQDRECDFSSDSDSDSEPSVVHGTVQSTEMSACHNPRNPFESSKSDKKRISTEHSGAQWDVFRRQDVPKLVEYLRRHCDELFDNNGNDKKMVHPILDQSIFLDETHKIRLKEEFKIEPWSFNQRVGEAVIIPAGCPYQIRNPKCCVHVVLEFVSPENVSECIKLTDEVRLLPEDHKFKVDKLEVKKMALNSMSAAIKEIRELTSKT